MSGSIKLETAPKNKRRWSVPLGIAAAAFFLLLSPLWAPLLLRRMAFFRVRHVEVVGARYVQPRDILARLKVDTLASVWDPTGRLEARVAADYPELYERCGQYLDGLASGQWL